MRRALLCALAGTLLACGGGPDEQPDPGEGGPVASALLPGPALARALAATLEAEAGGPVPDDLTRRRVAALHGRVAEAAGVPGRTLAVVDCSLLVLRALPGGHDQVSRGLLVALADLEPAEGRACLAALLARQCALAAGGEPERAAARAAHEAGIAALPSGLRPLIGLFAPAAGAAVEGSDEAPELAGRIGPLLRALRRARPSPEAAADADRAALRALESLGYPREALPRAWQALERVAARDPSAALPLLRTCGAPALLRAEAEALVAALPPPEPLSTREREEAPLDLTPLREEASEQARLDAAELLIRRGQNADAQRLLEGCRGPRALSLRGEALVAAGKPVEGERSLRAALLLHQDAVPARLALLRLYLAQGREEAARAELDEAGPRMPLLPALLLELAATARGDRARALLRATAALDEPDGTWALAAEARLRALDRAPPPPPPPPPGRSRILGGGGG